MLTIDQEESRLSSRGERSYQDPCGIARALDRVGERWALLLIRELIFGPKRFTDLRHGLPGASQKSWPNACASWSGTASWNGSGSAHRPRPAPTG